MDLIDAISWFIHFREAHHFRGSAAENIRAVGITQVRQQRRSPLPFLQVALAAKPPPNITV